MFTSYRIWYRSLSPTRSMFVDLFWNTVYYGLAYFVMYKFVFKEPFSLLKGTIFVTILAVLTTRSVNFRNIRAMFKRKDIQA